MFGKVGDKGSSVRHSSAGQGRGQQWGTAIQLAVSNVPGSEPWTAPSSAGHYLTLPASHTQVAEAAAAAGGSSSGDAPGSSGAGSGGSTASGGGGSTGGGAKLLYRHVVDAAAVRSKVGSLLKRQDLSKFIL